MNCAASLSVTIGLPLVGIGSTKRRRQGHLPIAHRRDRLLVPIEIWPDVRAPLAAAFAYEPRLKIRKPNVIGPLVRADRDRVAAAIISAIDQNTAHA
jgi:hypothetical protein